MKSFRLSPLVAASVHVQVRAHPVCELVDRIFRLLAFCLITSSIATLLRSRSSENSCSRTKEYFLTCVHTAECSTNQQRNSSLYIHRASYIHAPVKLMGFAGLSITFVKPDAISVHVLSF